MDNAPQTLDTLAIAQQFQDRLIARRLPDWVIQVHDMHYPDLVEALHIGLRCRQRLRTLWSRVEQIERFARQQLQAAMHARQGAHLDIDQLFFRQYYFFISPEHSPWTGRLPLQDMDYYDVSLLDAALQNFTQRQAEPDGQPKRNTLVDASGNVVEHPRSLEFAKLCRGLDIGGQYQRHLDAILKAPAGPEADDWDFKEALAQQQRTAMLVDALKAWTEDTLSWLELQVVIRLYHDGMPGGLEGVPVTAKQLHVLGCGLQQIVVLDATESGQLLDTSIRVLVYIPGDPHGPWSTADTITAFARDTLAKRMRQAEYRHFLGRFVLRRDSRRFFSRASERVEDGASGYAQDLDEAMTAYPKPLFQHLATARIAQIKDDAAMIAMPTARVDRAVQRDLEAQLKAEGKTLLELAGLFIPGVAEALEVAKGWELLTEIFHSIESWAQDDTRAALDHLMNVAEEAALYGVMPEGAAALRSTWERAEAVDRLVPALLEDGSEKLWNQDLTPFRSEPPPVQATRDKRGVHSLGEQRWIEIEGQFYAVSERDDDTWFLNAHDRHAPEVVHNDAGAWRLWTEQPVEWEDARHMFRRLGGPFGLLRDDQVDQVMAIHGLDADVLRGLHVYGKAPGAELLDTVQRIALVNRVDDLAGRLRAGFPIEDHALLAHVRGCGPNSTMSDEACVEFARAYRRELFQHMYDEQNVITDQTRALRQAGLHRLAAEQLLDLASDAELQGMLEQGRVPPRLADIVSVCAARIRGVRAFEALCFEMPQSLDLARLVLRLLEKLPAAQYRASWSLFDGDSAEPLLTTQGDGPIFGLVYLDGQFLPRDEQGRDIRGAGELFQVIASAHYPAQHAGASDVESRAQALRAWLIGEVLRGRQAVMHALGGETSSDVFLLPPDLSEERRDHALDSRPFKLSKRRPKSLQARLRYFFPDFDDEDIERWLQGIRNKSKVPGVALGELELEYRLLRQDLKYWVWGEGLARPSEIKCRRLAKTYLKKAWRRLIPRKTRAKEIPDDILTIGGAMFSRLTTLPALSEGIEFTHVAELLLRAMPLETIPSSFLGAFVNLQRLEVTGCKIERVPLHRVFDRQLQVLDLSDNEISLDGIQSTWVSFCKSLVYLNLSNNPLGMTPGIKIMRDLQTLILKNADLSLMPLGLLVHGRLSNFDISGNTIVRIPSAVIHSGVWRNGRVRIDNPLYRPMARDWQEPLWSEVPMRLVWQDFVNPVVRDSMALAWVELEQFPESQEFFTLVHRVARSLAFSREDHAVDLANRLYTLLVDMLDDPALRTHLFAIAVNAHCEDNAITCFSNLEISRKVWNARRAGLGEEVLVGLLGELWRLDQVEEAARVHAMGMQHNGREAVEVVLYFRVELNDSLDLGLNRLSIRFGTFAEVDESVLEQVREGVRARQTESALVADMLERSFWVDYLKNNYAPRFEVPDDLQDQYNALIEAGEDEEAAQVWGAIRALEPGVARKLTCEALRRFGGGWKVPIIFDMVS